MNDEIASRPHGGELVIAIRNTEPLAVDVVADLLHAVANDYKQLSGGRTLSVRQMRTGSLFIHLWDMTQAGIIGAGGVLTVIELTKHVRSALKAAREGRSLGSRSRGMKTVRALIKTSRQSHADIEIDYESENERISVRLSRGEAEEIHLRDVTPAPTSRVTHQAALTDRTARADREIEAFARAAVRDGPVTGPRESDGLIVLLRILVQDILHSAGGRERLSSIVRNLRAHGDGHAADFLVSLIEDEASS
ncbi:MAG: hypothetical protein EON90_09150 [Brevundimonas sp.]|nr:MAG: hypothetical protein EON90_09150 [Brevundimonas sp.]